jgi:predicted transcriptional regulator
MTTKELQESIIQKIRRTNDDELLNYLNQLLSGEVEQKTYKLSDIEKNMLAESEADYLAGRTILNELHAILYSKILSVTDEHQLSDLITAIDQSNSAIYYTSAEQKAKIMEGQEQIAKGNYFTNEQVEKEVDQWLNKE